MIKPKIYYHANCMDGIAAAWVAKEAFPEGAITAINYGKTWQAHEQLELIQEHDGIIFVDISPTPEQLEQLPEVLPVIVIDHHATAKNWHANYPIGVTVHYSEEHSGCGLAWKILFPEGPAPYFIQLIEDRDLWKFYLADSKPFNAFLNTLDKQELLSIFSSYMMPTNMLFADIATGRGILAYQKQLVLEILSTVRPVVLKGEIIGYGCYCPASLSSEVGSAINTSLGATAILWHLSTSGEVKLSYRGEGAKELAEALGGGGHAKAAGAVGLINFGGNVDYAAMVGFPKESQDD